ncbi:MAG: AAA family ATPase [Campylobacterales bacterium]|nr:AAA family ATPase [Campylobacterales bacterium]MBN2833323.1 AAA family ATPase [Campylobacterales bacterium]
MSLSLKLIEILQTRHALLTGGAGVGKSYLVGEVVTNLRKIGKQVVVLGSTGVSAVNVGGQTVHSFFAFGICNDLDELTRHDRYTKARLAEIKKVLSRCDLLVIDEISMVSADLLDMMYYRLRNAGFEGSVLFVGDFFQLPPVSKAKNDSLLGGLEYAFESSAWSAFKPVIVELTKTKRTHDECFFEHLSHIRKGHLKEETLVYLDALRNNVSVWDDDPTVLFGRNKEAEMLNIQKLAQIQSEPIVLKAKEKVHEKSLHVNKIEGWKNALPVPVDLTLKVGAKVLFCTNKWGKYYNGERGIVHAIDEKEVVVEKAGEFVKVERQEYTLHENVLLNGEVQEKPLVSLEQFPLKLAYAITIHKSQGMSIDSLVCNINTIFEKSQFYVAISRARYPNQLLLDYHYARFSEHVRRCVQVSPKVGEFYEKSEILKIEEQPSDSLFDAF